MAKLIPKISAEQLAQMGVVAAPDKLTGSPQENKLVFDRLIREVVAVAVNLAIDTINEMLPAEEDRAEAEQGRVTAEEARVRAENERAEAETAREQAEDLRTEAEGRRETAEAARRQAETERTDRTNGIVAQATTQAEAAAGSAVKAANSVTEAAGEVTKAAAQVEKAKDQVDLAEKEVAKAQDKVEDAEAWAKGTRGGEPVAEDDPAHQNNAAYYAARASEVVGPQVTPGELEAATEELDQRIDGLSERLEEVATAAQAGQTGGGGATGELEDLEIRQGSFVNAGAGWNRYRFPVPFEGVPRVVLQPENFSGWAEIRTITAEGFLYCLRKPVYTAGQAGSEGSVETGDYYTASGSSSSSGHTQNTLVKAVTLPTAPVLPTAENKTTSEAILVHWMATEYNGDDIHADE